MNKLACLIAFMFIGANLYIMFKCDDCQADKLYIQSLNDSQLAIYKEIVNERKKLAIMGMLLGLLLAILFSFYMKLNPLANGCLFVAIVFVTQYLYYMTMKKSKYMIQYLNEDQTKLWLNVYKEMQSRYYNGMLLGLVGYFVLGYFL